MGITPKNAESLSTGAWMESICEPENLREALKRVKRNRGAPGVDGMSVEALGDYLREHWKSIKQTLLAGTYKPQDVRQVEIPKQNGRGVRKIGVPSALDRFIQQAILQKLQAEIDETFSDYSYGFRPGKSAHQAISQAQEYVAEGYTWVVDIDLEKFFDQISHDKLMSELAKRVEDKRLLKLVRRYLKGGILDRGSVNYPEEGAIQGGPLSPCLSNIMLDLLDRELERRGHRFCRYADDCNIYVKSQRAGERVMRSIKRYIEKQLKLKVNAEKSRVDRVYRRGFLGFSFIRWRGQLKRRIAKEAVEQFKQRIRELTKQSKGMEMNRTISEMRSYVRGWLGYYGYCQTPSVLKALESWIYRRLRGAYWRQWRTIRNRQKQLIKRGVNLRNSRETGASSKGPWRIASSPTLCMAFPRDYFTSEMKLPVMETHE